MSGETEFRGCYAAMQIPKKWRVALSMRPTLIQSINKVIAILFTVYMPCTLATLSGCTLMPYSNLSYAPDSSYEYKKNQFLNYREIGGSGKTLILLHGFGASNRTWDDVLPHLKKLGFHLILVDLIGSGFSSIPKDSDYSMEANADAIIGFIKSKNVKQYVLIGHSFGGGVVLNIALSLNERSSSVLKPDGLVLIDSAAYDTGLPFFVEHLRVPLLGRFLLTVTPPRFRARYTLERIYFDKSKVTSEKVDRYAFFLSRQDSDTALLESAKQIIPKNYADLTKQYKTLHFPTLILWGAQDTTLSIEGGQRLAAAMPDARLILIDKCGHNSQEEQPAEVARQIENFLTLQ